MPTQHAINIYHALKKYNLKAAKEYLDYADERERINKIAKENLGDTLEYYHKKTETSDGGKLETG